MLMSFNSLVSLETGRLEWRVKVKVRVTRKWNVESSFFRGKVNTIELILLDIDVSLYNIQQFFFYFFVGCVYYHLFFILC